MWLGDAAPGVPGAVEALGPPEGPAAEESTSAFGLGLAPAVTGHLAGLMAGALPAGALGPLPRPAPSHGEPAQGTDRREGEGVVPQLDQLIREVGWGLQVG